MDKILVVEDSKSLANLLKEEIEKKIQTEVVVAMTYAEAIKAVESDGFSFAILDYHLPDANDGEAIDLVLSKNIPSIVFTSELNDDIRDKIWSKRVVDYVLKEDSRSIDYIVYMIKRIKANASVKVLVVDDSSSYRIQLSSLLRIHQYKVYEASNGLEAMSIMEKVPDIKLILTDIHMPEMDGYKLLKKVRAGFDKEALAIIGISSYGDRVLSAKFIKLGANDFIKKPFLSEELYCRVTQNIEMLTIIHENKEASNRDYLTGLYNRRYFFDVGRKLLSGVKRGNSYSAVAMLDIDHFKRINDTYGHDVGDMVIRMIAGVLKDRFRESDIVARFGGEEFCVLVTNIKRNAVYGVFNELRAFIEGMEITAASLKIRITVSIGVCDDSMNCIEDMIKKADVMLYAAKNGGRNKVMSSSAEKTTFEKELQKMFDLIRLANKFAVTYKDTWDSSSWQTFFSAITKKHIELNENVLYDLRHILDTVRSLYETSMSSKEIEAAINLMLAMAATQLNTSKDMCGLIDFEQLLKELQSSGLTLTDKSASCFYKLAESFGGLYNSILFNTQVI
ncbi:MAG: diguanylate cyclase [Nitrospirae bacterium]|nr:diguanylate cyclase [Nitrospirota bacterium]